MRLHSIALAIAALAPLPAAADPVTAVTVLTLAAEGLGYIGAAEAAWILLAANVYGTAQQRRTARRAAAAARQQYNDSLTDRSVTLLQAEPPLRYVYGRCIAGGDILAMFTTDKTGYREDGSTYTKPDALKHLVVHVASREVQAINEIYIDGSPLGTLDGNGYPTGGEFYVGRQDSRIQDVTTTFTLSQPAVAIINATQVIGSGQDATYVDRTADCSISGGGYTLNGPAGVTVTISYRVDASFGTVRVQKHLGATDQLADSYLTGLIPTQWTSNHRLRGRAYCVITLDLEEPRFQGGPPGLTFDTTGHKVLDPRTGATAWSSNPALCIYDFLTGPWGYNVAAADVDTASVIAAANACDATISLTVGGTTTTGPCFTLNGEFTSAQNRETVLNEMATAMGGFVVAAGPWTMEAGAWTPPVMTLTDDDLNGQIEVVQAGADTEALFNGARGSYIEAGKATPTDCDPYQNASYLTADNGVELWNDFQLPWTDNRARARNLLRIQVERIRSGLVLRYPAKLRAWPLQVGDRVTLSSAEYQISAQTFRVTDWQFGITSPVMLQLQADSPSIYLQADAATALPAPATGLPNPWLPDPLASLAATSGTATMLRTDDGTIVPRVKVTWAAATAPDVVNGGRIEIFWRRNNLGDWTAVPPVTGDATQAYIVGVQEGDVLTIEGRVRNARNAVSDSRFTSNQVIGKSALPANVSGLATSALPGGVLITVTPSTEVDVISGGYIELRQGGANWAAATRIFRGPADRYTWPWPSAGTYTLRAKWIDSSGNESATDATTSVTVGSGNLINTAQLNANAATEIYSDTYDFAGGTFTKSSTPQVLRTLTFTPSGSGTVEFSATIAAEQVLPDSGNQLYWQFTPSGGSTTTLGACNSTSGSRQTFPCAASFSVTGGVAVSVDLVGKVWPSGNPAMLLYASSMRATVVKR